ncbi:hypothetical protein COM11_20200 [Bacillus pseudomycoides]|uniref:hypothetical protein n=1 Tax=Bacillus pseudomycoides TaxID=64104 RepID=UPI000BEBBDA7|nr:hypothetical protein [Bacillus pseudomycoides]PDY48634.1 hypothetical protein CON79_03345 [Bacillus pseudomycoides]PGC27424.1 hypothetical protein COM11_20200 [Bacillus pseudomycoides]PHB45405.1 hypothetical protein COE83_16940 [Bacillus pseudomycoides]
MDKTIQQMIDELNVDSVEEIKPQLKNKISMMQLGLVEDSDVTAEEVEKLVDFMKLRNEFLEETPELTGNFLVGKFQQVFDEFTDSMIQKGYVEHTMSFVTDLLKCMDARAELTKIMLLRKKYDEFDTKDTFYELKNAFYRMMNKQARGNLHREMFLVTGCIHTILFDLEEQSQEHGRGVISCLTDYTTGEQKSVKQFEEEEHVPEVKKIASKEYGVELQRRIHMWKSLTFDFTSPYVMEKMYEEIFSEKEEQKDS